jgi:hypothetical protein
MQFHRGLVLVSNQKVWLGVFASVFNERYVPAVVSGQAVPARTNDISGYFDTRTQRIFDADGGNRPTPIDVVFPETSISFMTPTIAKFIFANVPKFSLQEPPVMRAKS